MHSFALPHGRASTSLRACASRSAPVTARHPASGKVTGNPQPIDARLPTFRALHSSYIAAICVKQRSECRFQRFNGRLLFAREPGRTAVRVRIVECGGCTPALVCGALAP
jgi:hypothetical protein